MKTTLLCRCNRDNFWRFSARVANVSLLETSYEISLWRTLGQPAAAMPIPAGKGFRVIGTRRRANRLLRAGNEASFSRRRNEERRKARSQSGSMMNRETPPSARFPIGTQKADDVLSDSQGEMFNVGDIIATLIIGKRLIVLGALALAVLSGVFLFQLDNTFKAKTDLQLLRGERRVIDIENIVETQQLGEGDILSEIAIIQSPVVLERVATRLALPDYAEFQWSPTLMEIVVGTIRDTISGLFIDPEEGGGGPPRTAEQIAADILSEKVSVSQLGLSYILTVEVRSTSQSLVAPIANAIVDEYIAMQIETKLAASNQATAWLDGRVSDLSAQLMAAEAAVEEVRATFASQGVPSLAVIEQQVIALSAQQVAARVAHADAIALRNAFDRLTSRRAFSASLRIVESEPYRVLVDRIENIDRQIAALSERAGPDELALRALQASRVEVEANLVSAARDLSLGLEAQIGIAKDRVEAILADIIELESLLVGNADMSIQLRVLERQAETTRQVYQQFLTRLTGARERGSFQEPNARVIARAEQPGSPSSPKRTRLMALIFVVGLLLTGGGVLLREARRDAFRTAADLTAATGLPVLASVPNASIARRNPGAIAAMMRRLEIELALWNGERAPGIVLVTSTLTAEDADLVGRLLVEAAVADGRRVALLEAKARDGRKDDRGGWTSPAPIASISPRYAASTSSRHRGSRSVRCSTRCARATTSSSSSPTPFSPRSRR